MNYLHFVLQRLRWAGLPTPLLVSLLQRTPALRVVAIGEEVAASAPISGILRSVTAAAASLGALHTLAGATSIVASPKSPLNATVGIPIAGVVFGATGAQQLSSWVVASGSKIPPGLNLTGLTGPGVENNAQGYATLTGTPTTAGTYSFTLQGYEFSNAQGLSTPALTYTVVVSANLNAPSFSAQPQDQTVNVGQTATLTAAATGSPARTYQWQFNGSNLAGATGATLTLANVQASNAGLYAVVAANSNGTVTSASALLTVVNPNNPPVFTTQPISQSVPVGVSLTLTAFATGTPSPTYQWQKNGANLSDGGRISGSATATLGIANAQQGDAGTYTVVATNAAGSSTSSPAVLTFNTPQVAPSFPSAGLPISQSVASGSTVTFTAQAFGSPVPTYQWLFQPKGASAPAAISGATDATLLISNATASNAGNYSCTATNSSGSVTSLAASLAVVSTGNVGRLINLSVNTTAGKGQVLTVGFVTGGTGTSGPQNLLIRATGPALGALGVGNYLADPTLTVLAGQNVVASNDNWGTPATNQAAVTAADNATGAFPLTNPSSLDAALVTSLQSVSGGYTVQVSGNTPASGTTLAEIYDDTPANGYTPSTPRLINISSNDLIAANGSLTAGFVVGGSTAKTVLIRADGPALAGFGVSNAMPDPQLALHTTVSGQDQILATNAGWGGDPQLTAVGNSVGAFALTNASSKDSVILTTLPPGSYTAIASSASGTAGIVVIEVYEVP